MKITIEVEIDENELGEILICDDPEHFPLVHYGFIIQGKLAEILGYDSKVKEELKRKARETIEKPDAIHFYSRLTELAQEWAIERLREIRR